MKLNISALLIIDVQKAIDHPKWGERNNPDAEKNIAQLLAHWRRVCGTIVHIQHNSIEEASPYRAGQPFHDFKQEVMPLTNEIIVGKTTNNAFVDTDLLSVLKQAGVKSLVICGVLTQHSVDCTARMAASLGYDVTVVTDATAATGTIDNSGKYWSAEDVHQLTLAHLKADYAYLKSTDELFTRSL